MWWLLIAPFLSRSLVPESLLKKRRTVEAVKAKRAAKAVAEKAHRKKVRQIAFKSAEKYVKEYRQVSLVACFQCLP